MSLSIFDKSVLAALLLFVGPVAVADAEPDGLATARAHIESIPREYRLDGVVEAVSRTTVSAQTNGQVAEIFYDVDDVVEKDAILVQLKDTEHRARVAQAAAELKSATAKLEQARDEHERVAGLFAKKNVSASAMDQAKAELKAAQARLDAAQAALHQAQEQLAYTQIRAPYSGIVTQRHVEIGEVAGPGQPVMSGVSLERLRVSLDVPQSLIPILRAERQVRVYRPNGEPAEIGEVTIFPYADAASNSFEVRVDLKGQPEGLFPGMFVKTGIVTGARDELLVPRSAVVYRSEVTGVYVVGAGGQVRFRQVRIGRAIGDDLTVLAGLDAGEQVALDPIAAGIALKQQARERMRLAEGAHND
jgi:RND family efflux transporter MFP subunit